MLEGKKIILGISGGIAAYKSAQLTRLLIKAGAEVQIVITPAGKEFITPVTLSALSGKPVICDFFDANNGSWHSHVDIGLWADAMVVAPATACTIAKMAHGVADNMLVTSYLSSKSPVFVAPAMDLDMWNHPTTTKNISLLESYGNHIIEPENGELASHLVGKGRMADPERIVSVLDEYFSDTNDLNGKRVLITAGPTHEKIDPVRFIGNYSSGKMGYSIAEECAERGAEVILVSGPVHLQCKHKNIRRIDVVSASEMLDACMLYFKESDIAIMCAAVADYSVENISSRKIKREKDAVPELKLKKNVDIAKTLGGQKRPNQMLVGFALETDNEEVNAKIKLERKNLDYIVLNSLSDPDAGFQTDTNKVTIISRRGDVAKYGTKDKKLVAKDIVDVITNNRQTQ